MTCQSPNLATSYANESRSLICIRRPSPTEAHHLLLGFRYFYSRSIDSPLSITFITEFYQVLPSYFGSCRFRRVASAFS